VTLLQDKIGFVTGGASGIGRASALLMAREGAAVAVADHNRDGAEAVAEAVRAAGGRAIALTGDVARAVEVEAMVQEAVAQLGSLDCAVNCAGMSPPLTPLGDLSDDDWALCLAVNLTGVRNCMKSQIRNMAARGGSIVNIASGAGLEGVAGLSAYVASKHGVVGATKTAALDYARQGVRINALCPGLVLTPMTQAGVDSGALDIAALCPIGRAGRPEEVAEAAVWLCSDRASFVTGVALPVDGGHLAG